MIYFWYDFPHNALVLFSIAVDGCLFLIESQIEHILEDSNAYEMI